MKWEIPESPDDCLIQEYRNPSGQFDRRTYDLPGHDDLRHSLLRDFLEGTSLDDIAIQASRAIGRRCDAYVSYGFLCVIAEYTE
ncbi:hypothetical protein Gbth_003_060 [Gluconobacter thailandicus F149-1 = NBRC 100600]|uniref:Uncharacterized protein n=1 Tax=Gluconobacter thailandicus NBRC 3257 TaxID=1381097 RepID=A0ABQ0IZL0_GLUTH|nr:hypothetical protein [Gluconobacter thailandicus]KXV53562.1 hypothetical protein AD946_07465 [Gluconobacter thailandicus]GAC88465.1 hypothetical protein NBRC3255_2126 [Gluconobacter thailandicus NBRC 3255]GAD27643.1 hypothetical protein NBRC3257_2642 [Gluconobacter thailandicus NBRC 3257]GAN91986.1 hypothetical protein Gbth_003_060 [Gluconobacter thailandicus F149-1 = NBRC 100600]GBR61687.1 hypothetical protein AA100600_3018 [Gluconobacter thailandicus F149-1 = NBRC 100600]